MSLRTDQGCGTPQEVDHKEVYKRLISIFAPIVRFDPQERFYPVDLQTNINSSSVWRVNHQPYPPTTQLIWNEGTFDPAQDVAVTTEHDYTTVVGTKNFTREEDEQTFILPTPLIDDVYQKYTDGSIDAELSIYATVCIANEDTNIHLLKYDHQSKDGSVSEWLLRDSEVQEAFSNGLIVNYYMFFPARESPEFESEGDWSGISLLLKNSPQDISDLDTSEEIKRFSPVLACYFSKTIDGAPPSPHFVARTQGLRRWQNVQRAPYSQTIDVKTHPVVYVSLGRHNCYFEGVTNRVELSPPWNFQYTPNGIESGEMTSGPADITVRGYTDWGSIPWWAYAAFPPLFIFVACASGCEYPVHFDGTIPPHGYEEGEDITRDGGYGGLASDTGSSYPPIPASEDPTVSRHIYLRLRYVDLDDATMAALWGYPGAWGAATLHIAGSRWGDEDPSRKKLWGYYQGVRRPSLSAWFVWNLFLDTTFGCGGRAEVTSLPSDA